MLSFLYPFTNFFQPGILWPQTAAYAPTVALSLLGLIVGLAKKSTYPRSAAFSHPIFIWLAVFIVLQPISLMSSGLMAIFTGFEYWYFYLVFVVVSILLIRDEQTLARYVLGMMAGSMFIVIFGICAVVFAWPEAIGGRAGAYGMYENHNDYSFIIIQTLPFLYMYRKITQRVLLRLLLGVSLIACVVGILLSLSRGGMLALLLEFGLIILIGMDGRKRLWWLPVLLIIGVGGVTYQWAKRAENQGSNYTAADAENSRLELWSAAGNLILDKPLLGVGSARFGEYAQQYGEISKDNRGKNTHNTYLEILTGTGLIGFFIFINLIRKLLGALRGRFPSEGLSLLEAMRRATLISFYSILFRATLDAKPHDWSFYVLFIIGLSCVVLQRQAEASANNGAQLDARVVGASMPRYT